MNEVTKEVGGVPIRYREIVWAPGYWVGEDGAVFSARDARGRIRPDRWVRLSIYRRPYGARYCVVCLRPEPGGKVVQWYVHRLVLELFVGPSAGRQACHWDGNTANNAIPNLRWGTCAENGADKDRHGTRPRGETHARAKLTANKVRLARAMRSGGCTYRFIGEHLGVSPGAIQGIVAGRRWKHVI